MCSGPRLKKSSTHEPPSTIHSIRAVQTTDRGTYLCRRTTTPPSGERWLRENGGYTHRSHPLPSGGCRQENLHYGSPPARERWLRENGGYTLRSHPLPSGGCCQENLHYGSPPSGERWLRISTVWRTVATTTDDYANSDAQPPCYSLACLPRNPSSQNTNPLAFPFAAVAVQLLQPRNSPPKILRLEPLQLH